MLPTHRWLAGATALCVLALACAPGAPAADDDAEQPTRVHLDQPCAVPFLDDDQPLVRANVPGLGEITLLVDTGAEFSWIDAAFAERGGLPREPLGATLTDIQGVESTIAERTRIARLELGSLAITNFRPPLLQTLREAVDGSLGQDVLRVLDVVIDGPGRRLVLLPRDSFEERARELFQPGNAALTYTPDWSSGIPVIHVGVADLPGYHAFQIDTGSGPMTFAPELVEALDLQPTGREPGQGLSHAGNETETYDVEGLELERLVVSSNAHAAPRNALGWGVLRSVVCVFPAAEDMLLIFPDPAWSLAWEPSVGRDAGADPQGR